MARNFNANANRHLYVVKKYVDKADDVKTTGDITLEVTQGKGNVDKAVYFLYKGADTVLRSSLIQVKNIDYVKAIKAADMRVPFKSQLVTLDSNVSSTPVSGQDYILRIVLRQWIGMGDDDVYYKEAAVHATAKMTAEDFYKKMVEQLNLVFSREVGATKESNPYLSFSADANGITITEKAQDWVLGLEQQLPVLFDAEPATIYVDGADQKWGTVTNKTPEKSAVTIDGDTPTGRGNGHDIADLEYFSMGERGDQYRMVGFPKVIPTTYLVEPDKEYNVLEIHHAFTDTGINSYKSDKDITIVATDAAVIDSIVGAINKATGLEVESTDSSSSSTSGSGSSSDTGNNSGTGGSGSSDSGEANL